MIRWHSMLWMTWPLWFACEKQGPRDPFSRKSEASIPDSRRHFTTVSEARRTYDIEQSHTEMSDPLGDAVGEEGIWSMIEEDPCGAWRHVESQKIADQQRQAILSRCVMTLTNRDRDSALHWVANLASPIDRRYAQSRLAVAWAAHDPAEAAGFFLKQGIHGHDDEVAAIQILQLWGQRSGADAIAWALTLPTSSLRKSGLEAVSEQWFLVDSAGYGQWLVKQKQSDSYEDLLAASSEVLGRQVPEKRRELLQAWPEILQQRVLSDAAPSGR